MSKVRIAAAGVGLAAALVGTGVALHGSADGDGRAVRLAAASGHVAGGPGAAGAGKTKQYLQFNIAGNSMHGGKVTPAKTVVSDVKARLPYVVTLNEVCGTQFDYIEEHLASYGYRAQHGHTGVNCKDGSAFGNVVLIKIASERIGNWKLPNPVNGEHRRLLCVKATNYAMAACATHISYGKDDKEAQVSAVAARMAKLRAKGYRVILGGDFNLQPHHTQLDPIYASCYPSGSGAMYEAAAHRCGARDGAPTVDGKWKLDYLFFTGQYEGLQATTTSTPVSDHTELWATATY